jgi:hypothetical protein
MSPARHFRSADGSGPGPAIHGTALQLKQLPARTFSHPVMAPTRKAQDHVTSVYLHVVIASLVPFWCC